MMVMTKLLKTDTTRITDHSHRQLRHSLPQQATGDSVIATKQPSNKIKPEKEKNDKEREEIMTSFSPFLSSSAFSVLKLKDQKTNAIVSD
jgi:hypothetical protein